jgi:hypothetical protein
MPQVKTIQNIILNKNFTFLKSITLKILILMFYLNNSDVYLLLFLGLLIGSVLYLYCKYVNTLEYLFTMIKRFDKYLIYLCVTLFMIYILSRYTGINYFYHIKNLSLNTILLDDHLFTFSDIQVSMKDVLGGLEVIGGAAVLSAGIKASASILKTTAMSGPPTVKLGFVLAGGASSYFTFKTSAKM